MKLCLDSFSFQYFLGADNFPQIKDRKIMASVLCSSNLLSSRGFVDLCIISLNCEYRRYWSYGGAFTIRCDRSLSKGILRYRYGGKRVGVNSAVMVTIACNCMCFLLENTVNVSGQRRLLLERLLDCTQIQSMFLPRSPVISQMTRLSKNRQLNYYHYS